MIRALIFDYYGVIRPNGFRLPGQHNDAALLEYIANLRSDYVIGLLSNAESAVRLRAMLEPYVVDDYFNVVVASGDTNYAKPDPHIYKLVAQQLGVEPSQCAMVDDSADYTAGVQAAGMLPIHYRGLAQLKADIASLANA